MGKKVFVVEDDPFFSRMIRHKLSMDPELDVQVFENGASFLRHLSEFPSVITLDHSLPDYSGLDLMKKVREKCPSAQCIILSGQDNMQTTIEFMREGAYDYLVKDNNALDKLWMLVHKAIERSDLHEEVHALQEELNAKYSFGEYIKGSSAPMQRVFSLLEKTLTTSINVTVIGETGTGKELVAKSIHYNSPRKKKPFIAVNVAAIPKELIESEMFGFEKGAFTGADQSRIGKFEEANGGTLFLDEIGEMDLSMQAKLLRVLQEREVVRIGSNKSLPVDIRIIAATHRDLLAEVRAGRFREDLFYRLLGITIELPPLRERENDIVMLAKVFADDFCTINKIRKKRISADAKRKLESYSYPGNVRELKALIEIACVMSEGDEIMAHDVQFHQSNVDDDILSMEMSLDEYNARIIRKYLGKYNNNVVKVAEKLQIGKSTIYRMIKEGKI
jgi:two-component system, NtrC family, response regulator AtoC